jgi:hypothetical protein
MFSILVQLQLMAKLRDGGWGGERNSAFGKDAAFEIEDPHPSDFAWGVALLRFRKCFLADELVVDEDIGVL